VDTYNGVVQYHHTFIESNLGCIALVRSAAGLVRVAIAPSMKEALESIHVDYPDSMESAEAFGDLPQRLLRYLDGGRATFGDNIDLSGATEFHRKVLEAARAIPCGEVRSYGWLARQVGRPQAARAVGQALAHNPLPIVVPCHRVVGSDGSLTGFSGGLDMKRRLLDIEGYCTR
jgi:methylated-DNA-[protein]-cysteine S-methyltransferase